MENTRTDEPFLAIERTYPVAPEKVWRAWTDPEALKRWWAPRPDHRVSLCELDVRVGGRFRIVFGPEGGEQNECAGEYLEVEPNRRLVFSWHWPRSTPERVSRIAITFLPSAGGTELVFRHDRFYDAAARDNHLRGWTAAFGGLDRYIQSL
ncbi:MAG TPA: SRPBCC domain-containing protein [Burkholderiales bacterium]|nr:SRPBCC domain-containing protein [Burkholderiales bacterium]